MRLYHGTTSPLGPGDVLRPAPRAKHVYLAETPESALAWARAKAHRSGQAGPDPDDPSGYATTPTVPLYVLEVDAPAAKAAKTGFVAPRATVLRVVAVKEPGRRRPNPARTLDDLPPSAQIVLRQETLDDGWQHLSVDIVDGAKTIAHVVATRTDRGFDILESEAEHGFGPLAYDILMERATELGKGLGTGDPSWEAREVWRRYAKRLDVTSTRARSEVGATRRRHGDKWFAAGDRVFRKAPAVLLGQVARMPNVVYEGDWTKPGRAANPAQRAAVLRLKHLATVDEVLASFRAAYAKGRHGVPPDPEKEKAIRARGEIWVLADVPLQHLDYQRGADASEERVLRATRYALLGREEPPPGIAFYGERLQGRRTGRAYVLDGNHRALAAELSGRTSARMWMPRGDFDALEEHAA